LAWRVPQRPRTGELRLTEEFIQIKRKLWEMLQH